MKARRLSGTGLSTNDLSDNTSKLMQTSRAWLDIGRFTDESTPDSHLLYDMDLTRHGSRGTWQHGGSRGSPIGVVRRQAARTPPAMVHVVHGSSMVYVVHARRLSVHTSRHGSCVSCEDFGLLTLMRVAWFTCFVRVS